MSLEVAANPESGLAKPLPLLSPRAWATLAVLGSLWCLLINQLRLDWTSNPQYNYGWLVPFLAAYLFANRWSTRPEPSSPGQISMLVALGTALALLLLPTRVIRESAADWSPVSWGLAAEVIGLTLAVLVNAGGWATARHFAWPVCFFLVAVSWPVRFENGVTQGLMQRLAGLTAEILNWAGVSATPQGNLIRLASGVVGVDEACSGVRSLQSMLMASLFLGELNRFSLFGRFGLVLGGLALAVAFNLLRALWLVTIAIHQGMAALEKWHDSAGFSILALSFISLYLLVRFFRKRAPAPVATHVTKSWRPLPAGALGALAGWLALTEIGTELWYRVHENPTAVAHAWAVRWPEQAPGFKNLPVSPSVSSALGCNEGRQAVWGSPGGAQWEMFAFRWYPGRTSTLSARLHRPDICLPAAGRTLVAELPGETVTAGDLRIPFRVYQFDNQGQPLFVFYCLWEVGNHDQDSNDILKEYSPRGRLKRVLAGQRNLGQQSLEVVLAGPDTPKAATLAFRHAIGQIIAPL